MFEIADELGLDAEEGMIYQEQLFDMDELFLSGTTTEVMPVVRVDGREIGDGAPGPITRKLIDAYRSRVGG